MALRIFELADSREQTVGPESPNAVLRYGIMRTDDEEKVRALVQAELPAYYGDLAFQNYRLTPEGGGIWTAEAEYGQKEHTGPDSPTQGGETEGTGGGNDDGEKPPNLPWAFDFDTSGGEHKLLQSFATRSYVESEIDRKDYGGAILVKEDNKVEGVDVTIPTFAFTLKASARPPLPASWLQALYDMTGKVNSNRQAINARGTIIFFEPGELLCQGATGGVKEAGEWEMTLKMAANKNLKAGELIIGTITGIAKKGWEFLWVRYKEVEDDNHIVPEAVQVYVEQVYQEVDMSAVIGVQA